MKRLEAPKMPEDEVAELAPLELGRVLHVERREEAAMLHKVCARVALRHAARRALETLTADEVLSENPANGMVRRSAVLTATWNLSLTVHGGER